MKYAQAASIILVFGAAPFPASAQSWQNLGGPAGTEGAGACLAIDPTGAPIVAWQTESSPRHIYVRRWTGASWTGWQGSDTGEGISAADDAVTPAMIVDPVGRVIVVWVNAADDRIHLSQWAQPDPPVAHSPWKWFPPEVVSGTGRASDPALTLGPGTYNSYAATWVDTNSDGDRKIFVKQHYASSWLELGNINAGVRETSAAGDGVSGAATTDAASPTIAIRSDGVVFAAWSDTGSGNREVHVRSLKSNEWSPIGSVSASAGDSGRPRLVMGLNDTLLVAWEEVVGGQGRIYLRRLESGLWVEMGGSASGAGISGDGGPASMPALAAGFDDEGLGPEDPSWAGVIPVVAWVDRGVAIPRIHLRRWHRPTQLWQELHGSATGEGVSRGSLIARFPLLAMSRLDDICAAWTDDSLGGAIFVRRAADGRWWREIGTSASGGGVSASESTPSGSAAIAADDGGSICVAWEESTGIPDWRNVEIHVRMWMPDRQSWEELAGSATGGGISGTNGKSIHPAVTFDGPGRPVVAWEEETQEADTDIIILRWDGGSWKGISGSDRSGGFRGDTHHPRHPSLAAAPSGDLLVAWQGRAVEVGGNDEIFLKRWNAGTRSWEPIGGSAGFASPVDDTGGISATLTASVDPCLAVDRNGDPTVAWIERTLPSRVLLRKWSAGAWIELAGSATRGVNDDRSDCEEVWLSLDGGGHPAVAWRSSERDPATKAFLKRWRPGPPGEWEVLGGSASSDPLDLMPEAMAMGSDGRPLVAWTASNDDGTREIRLRAWHGTGRTWAEVDRSDSPGGIGRTRGRSGAPAMAVTPSGDPIMAWREILGQNGEIYLRHRTNRAPVIRGAIGQYRLDGIREIPAGGRTAEPGFVISASGIVDSEEDDVTLQVEVLEASYDFERDRDRVRSAGSDPARSSASVTLLKLDADRWYQWRARALDSKEAPGEWISVGGVPGSVFLRSNTAPRPGSLAQSIAPDRPLARGAYVTGGLAVALSAFVTDDDSDLVSLDLEFLRSSVPFAGQPTMTSAPLRAGGTASLTFVPEEGPFHWQCRAVDEWGVASSWMQVEGPGSVDFVVAPFGSLNDDPGCAPSAASGGIAGGLSCLGLLIVCAARRV